MVGERGGAATTPRPAGLPARGARFGCRGASWPPPPPLQQDAGGCRGETPEGGHATPPPRCAAAAAAGFPLPLPRAPPAVAPTRTHRGRAGCRSVGDGVGQETAGVGRERAGRHEPVPLRGRRVPPPPWQVAPAAVPGHPAVGVMGVAGSRGAGRERPSGTPGGTWGMRRWCRLAASRGGAGTAVVPSDSSGNGGTQRCPPPPPAPPPCAAAGTAVAAAARGRVAGAARGRPWGPWRGRRTADAPSRSGCVLARGALRRRGSGSNRRVFVGRRCNGRQSSDSCAWGTTGFAFGI